VELEELLLNMGYPILGIDRGNKADEPTDLTNGKYDFSSIEES
jgi:hypothetical protein